VPSSSPCYGFSIESTDSVPASGHMKTERLELKLSVAWRASSAHKIRSPIDQTPKPQMNERRVAAYKRELAVK